MVSAPRAALAFLPDRRRRRINSPQRFWPGGLAIRTQRVKQGADYQNKWGRGSLGRKGPLTSLSTFFILYGSLPTGSKDAWPSALC